VIAPPHWGAVAAGLVVPRLHGPGSVATAVAIVGATVMPHAIYLHSGLTQARFAFANVRQGRKALFRSNHEVLLALGVAGLVNVAMIILAARAFHDGSHDQITEIETAYRTLALLLGLGAAGLFMLALLASGFSSSIVAVMAGQAIMQGFVSFRIPLWLRRLVVMAPSFVVVVAGMDITRALVLSQVVLSLVLPVPMVALVRFTASRELMGEFANARLTNVLAVAATGFVCLLNGILLLAIAAQMITTSLTGTTASLPNAHLTSCRSEPPRLQVTTSYGPIPYISALRGSLDETRCAQRSNTRIDSTLREFRNRFGGLCRHREFLPKEGVFQWSG
jgi:manganese transport protein